MHTDITLQEKIQILEKSLTDLQKKHAELRKDYIALSRKGWLRKVSNKLSTVFATITALIASAEDGTTLMNRLSMFVQTLWGWARSGFKLTKDQEALARMEKCMSCPELIQPRNQCRLCGCLMNNKVKIASASCPLKKW